MKSLQLIRPSYEDFVTNLIFDACRGNEKRNIYIGKSGASVSFETTYKINQHLAVVKDSSGKFIASAIVDQFDC